MKQHVEGYVEQIVFRNEETGYTVVKILLKDSHKQITVVGALIGINVGEFISCKGNWSENTKFGSQFNVKHFDIKIPETTLGIEKYLSSGAVSGIGGVLAQRIVDQFGELAFEVFDMAPERLLEIEGIGKKKLKIIQASWTEQKDIRQIMVFLQNLGITPNFAHKIFQKFGQDSIEMVKENPFLLATKIDGIGFVKADTVARKLGLGLEDEHRIASGIIFSLDEQSNNGHTCFPKVDLIRTAEILLGVPAPLIEQTIDILVESESLFETVHHTSNQEETYIWLSKMYKAEKKIVEEMERLTAVEFNVAAGWELNFQKICSLMTFELSEEQLMAIENAILNKIHILSGGPGTGKSTISKVIVDINKALGNKILLAAPTGRASKRLSELCKHEAQTIHALLAFDFHLKKFRKNQFEPLECDLIILDEASMVDTVLMSALLSAIPDHAQLIIVGDEDQLPSVGAGNVLKDLMSYEKISISILREIFRQSSRSNIIDNAHQINKGKFPDISNQKDGDFFFIPEKNPNRIIPLLTGLIETRLPKAYGFKKLKDIQVLCPMNKGTIGNRIINEGLQKNLNKKNQGQYGPHKIAVGDKVIQTRNYYEKSIFNGDIGFIKKIDAIDKLIQVDFDGKVIELNFNEASDLELAYSVSIHKYQGSEVPCVIILLHDHHYMLLNRNLLYTAVTRGKQIVLIVGSKEAISTAVRNDGANYRHTGLKYFFGHSENKFPPIKKAPKMGSQGYEQWIKSLENNY